MKPINGTRVYKLADPIFQEQANHDRQLITSFIWVHDRQDATGIRWEQ
jgi:hypothetical protein